MRLTRWLNAAVILLLSFSAAGFAFGFIEPNSRTILVLALFIVCYGAFLVYPFFEEKWSERKHIGKAAHPQPRQDSLDSPGIADPAPSREIESRGSPEMLLDRAREDSSRTLASNAEVPEITLSGAPAVKPQALIEPNPPAELRTDLSEPSLGLADRLSTRRENSDQRGPGT